MTVRVALAGVGNCAALLLQGIKFYGKGSHEGLWHAKVGGLSVRDVSVVAAFDVDARKVGLDLSDAIVAEPNVAPKYIQVARTGITVNPGLLQDEPPPHLRGMKSSTSDAETVSDALKKNGVDLLLNLTSSGLDVTATAYAKAALGAGCSYANCTPSPVVSDGALVARFSRGKLVVVGDDLMSQFGGTIFHRGILKLMVDRGMRILKSYQLDVGGGTETFNTIEEGIRMTKRKVKTETVSSEVGYKFETVAGTTDYVDYLGNDRTSYFWIESKGFMNVPSTLDVYLRTSDAANAGNVLLDVIRAVSAARKRGNYGAVNEICAYGFKSPPRQMHYDEAYARFSAKFVRSDEPAAKKRKIPR